MRDYQPIWSAAGRLTPERYYRATPCRVRLPGEKVPIPSSYIALDLEYVPETKEV